MQKTHISSGKIALIWNALICHIAVLVFMEINMIRNTRPVEKFVAAHPYEPHRDILSGERLRSLTIFNKAATTIKSANGVIVKLKRSEAQQFSKMPYNTHLIASVLR
tara:strand:- start:6121 stop:6441 length:321 start_codon:yes stop_codon:yes gene_type:complete